jgi:hypothetical protein
MVANRTPRWPEPKRGTGRWQARQPPGMQTVPAGKGDVDANTTLTPQHRSMSAVRALSPSAPASPLVVRYARRDLAVLHPVQRGRVLVAVSHHIGLRAVRRARRAQGRNWGSSS